MAEKKKGPGRPKGSKNSKPTKAEEKARQIQEMNKRDKRVTDEIWAIVIIAVGCFLAVSVFTSSAGKVGEFMAHLLMGLFGYIGKIAPFYFICYGILLIAKKTSHINWKTFLLLFIMLLMICTGYSLHFIDENLDFGFSFLREYYDTGATLTSGGLFGMLIGSALLSWLGKIGTWIFIVVVILISLLLILNTPLSRFFINIHDKIEKKKLVKENAHLDDEANDDIINSQVTIDDVKKEHDIKIINSIFNNDEKEEEPVIEKVPEKPVSLKDIEPLTDTQRNNILKYVSDDSLFGSQEKSGSFGLEDKNETLSGFGLEGNNINSNSSFGLEEKENVVKNENTGLKDEVINQNQVKKYKLPPVSMLSKPHKGSVMANSVLEENARILEETLESFNVQAKVVEVTQGPTVTRYELKPNVGVKVSNIEALADDIALALAAKSIRIEAPIPGKSVVGIEIENSIINTVTLREVLESPEFKNAKSPLSVGIGKDISGKPIIGDIGKFPHLLIAGETGAGKSVCINTLIASILFKATPDEVRLILIDPKRGVELGKYNGIPYLRTPVVTDAKQAIAALNWAVAEMMNRYENFARVGAKDFDSYNDKVKINGELDKVMPRIVIIIDELADLMTTAKAQIEEAIQRLTQLARAAGMHVILATQRPSVNVITGVIKANVPSKIAFAVSKQTDSRVIIDMNGAEKLLGKGDMLFIPSGTSKPTRVQGAFISDEDVDKLIDYSKKQAIKVLDTLEPLNFDSKEVSQQTGVEDEDDEYLADAISYVVQIRKASTSVLQRRFRIGYNRAARLMDIMEEKGIIGPPDGSRPREVLLTNEELESMENDEQ